MVADIPMCGNLGSNTISLDSEDSDIPAGIDNDIASAKFTTIAGGTINYAFDEYVTVGGGCRNTAEGRCTSVGNGYQGLARGMYISHQGGHSNKVFSNYGTVTGGFRNKVLGRFSTLIGSGTSSVQGHHSLSLGIGVLMGASTALFGFSGKKCYSIYDNTIHMCCDDLFLNGERIDFGIFSKTVRMLSEDQSDDDQTVDELEFARLRKLVSHLHELYEEQEHRIAELLSNR